MGRFAGNKLLVCCNADAFPLEDQVHWEGIQQSGGSRGGIGAFVANGLHRVPRSATRRMADENIARAAQGVAGFSRETLPKGKISRRALINMRAGRSRPHRKNQQVLAELIQ